MNTRLTDLFVQIDKERSFSEELFVAIHRLLRWELRRRGAGFRLSPSCFGCADWDFWEDMYVRGDTEKVLRSTGPLMDLAVDCYEYAIIRRYGSLSDQLKVKENIDGLIRLNVRNFVTERQRKSDPCGTKAYLNLRAAVEELLLSGDWQAEGLRRGNPCNDTRLFVAGAADQEAASKSELDEWLSASPDAIEVARQIGASVRDDIQTSLQDQLRQQGRTIACMFFGDLVDVWKQRARRGYEGVRYREETDLAWSGDDEDGDSSRDLIRYDDERYVSFEEAFDNRRRFQQLREAVAESDYYSPVRKRLGEILEALEDVVLDKTSGELPSQAAMARRLEISTSTYSDDINRLREIISDTDSDV